MSGRRLVALLVLAGGLALSPARAAFACTCGALPLGNPLDLAGHHDARYETAFIGTVESVAQKAQTKRYTVAVRVEARLAGTVPARATVVQTGTPSVPDRVAADCTFGFAPGRRYLIEGHRTAGGTITTHGCSFTQAYGGASGTTTPEPDVRPSKPAAKRSPIPAIVVFAVLAIGAGVILRMTLRGERPRPH
jgi:hypothetical protein